MLRFLVPSAVLLAGLLYWLLSGGTGQREGKMPSPAGNNAQEQQVLPGNDKTALPQPLRMSATPVVDESSIQAVTPAQVAATRAQSSLKDAFDGESRSGAGAAERETQIRDLVAQLLEANPASASIRDLQCRSRHCRLSVEGQDQDRLTHFIDALQDERGFLGKAESMMLSRDGEAVVVYLAFPSEAAPPLAPAAAD